MNFELFSIRFKVPFLSVAVMSCVLILDESFKVCACFIAAIIHECGHLIAMYITGKRPKSIKVSLFDICIQADTHRGDMNDLFITLSGPVFNLLFAAVLYPFSFKLFACNIVIAVFNLLPVETFDGGHALKVMLNTVLNEKTTDILIKILTFIILIPLFITGLVVLMFSKYNYSLLLISLYLVAILFIK